MNGKKERGCLIPTVIIIVAIFIGAKYFGEDFSDILGMVGVFALIALPYLYYQHEMNSLVGFVTRERISEYYSSLHRASNLIDDVYTKKYIKSVEEGLGDLRHSLENKLRFYQEIIENDEKIYARQKNKKR